MADVADDKPPHFRHPYAAIDVDQEEALELQAVRRASDVRDLIGIPPRRSGARSVVHNLQNPYANEFYQAELALDRPTQVDTGTLPALALNSIQDPNRALVGLSKRDFETQCRLVFARYIPSTERGLLRQHHREFIARNSSRSPRYRAALVKKLRQYDIGDMIGTVGQFNREGADITEQKLQRIEKAVRDELGDDQ